MRSLRLKHVAEIITGQSPSGEDVKESGNIPFLQGCAEFGNTVPSPTRYCDSPPKMSPAGAWLISVRAPVGELNFADQLYGIGRGLAAIVATNAEPRYLGYVLQSARGDLSRVSTGSTYEAVSTSQIGNLSISLPDTSEQISISQFLEKETARIDTLIEKRAHFARLMMERRNSVVESMVTGRSADVRAISGDWLGSLPPGWKAERAKHHYRERRARSDFGDEELLTVSHLTGVTPRSEKNVNMFLAESNEGYKIVLPGDLAINTMWAWMGAMGVSSHSGIVSPSYGVYCPTSQELVPGYVDLLVRSPSFVAEATRRSKGINSSRLRLYPDSFLDMHLPIPPVYQQQKFIEHLRQQSGSEDVLRATNEQAERLLREFRSTLITAAVTGQIDVTTWGKQGQTDRRLDRIQEEMGA